MNIDTLPNWLADVTEFVNMANARAHMRNCRLVGEQ
jgi:hypothetical protein